MKIKVLLAAAAALAALPQLADAQGRLGGTLRVQPSVILDATGFEQPMAAATLFLPFGWRAQGGVLWGQQFTCTNGYVINWSAASPDGSILIALLPQEGWRSNNYGAPVQGCPQASFQNVQQYLQSVVERYRPGARILDYRPRPDLARDLAQFNSTTPTAVGEIRNWVDAGELLFAFNDRGREMRGTISAVATFSLTRAAAPSGGEMDSLSGSTYPIFAMTAPSGQLNFAVADAIRQSIKLNPQWVQRIANHDAAIGQVAIEEARRRSDIISQNSQEIFRIQQQAWQAQQESADHRAAEFDQLIRGTATYSGGAGGPVELPSSGSAWRMDDGTYVISDDPNFNPGSMQMSGTRLTTQ